MQFKLRGALCSGQLTLGKEELYWSVKVPPVLVFSLKGAPPSNEQQRKDTRWAYSRHELLSFHSGSTSSGPPVTKRVQGDGNSPMI